MKHQSFPVGIVKGYCINVVVDIKVIYLNKRYLSQNKIYYLDKIGQVYYVETAEIAESAEIFLSLSNQIFTSH